MAMSGLSALIRTQPNYFFDIGYFENLCESIQILELAQTYNNHSININPIDLIYSITLHY